MLLNNVGLLNGFTKTNIAVKHGKITAVSCGKQEVKTGEPSFKFNDAVAFPGLINSHDHLDFNCFPFIGNRIYKNYVEWGNDIHAVNKTSINEVLKIPQSLRTAWGIYKNLLAGVTTVVNHGKALAAANPLITVYQETQNLHSVQFQKNWRSKLNNPFLKNSLCVIHAGEGTDQQASEEIDALLQWNLLHRKLVGVHAVAMNSRQAKKFAGVVWCPESNKLLLNKQAAVKELNDNTSVVFGTDSTLTGHWNIWHHLRLARQLQLIDDASIYNMVSTVPARLWNINTGEIKPGKDADIVIAKANGSTSWDSFYSVNPATILMVLHKGHIRLFDGSMLPQLEGGGIKMDEFTPVNINGVIKYVAGNLPAFMQAIKSYHPGVFFPVTTGITAKEMADD